jgi:RNA-directed DNA polymerase
MNTQVVRHSERWLAFELSHPRERLRILAATADSRYRRMELKDKNGKLRPIRDPSPELKFVQGNIREKMLLPIPLSSIVYSDVPGRSAVLNAKQHLNQPNVASVDIRRCYPSMMNAMVFGVFRGTLSLSDNLAHMLTRLSTLEGHLPQGAPTSGALANLILSPIDLILEDIAARLGLVVTRYVDNIDFSGIRAREAILPAIAALQRAGFAVGRKKVFNAGHRAPHIVTGQLVDGRTARLPRAKRANVRANVDEIICRHEAGLPISTKAMNRARGRLQYLRVQGHQRDAERLSAQIIAAGIIF